MKYKRLLKNNKVQFHICKMKINFSKKEKHKNGKNNSLKNERRNLIRLFYVVSSIQILILQYL